MVHEAVLVWPAGVAPQAPVAGVMTVSRLLVAAGKAGIKRVYVGNIIADRRAAVADDLARAACNIEVVWSAPPADGAERLRLTASHLPPPELQEASSSIPLSDPALATRLLLKGTSKASDGLVSRYLNRPISQAVTAQVLKIPAIRPLHLTAGTALLGLAMALCLVQGGAVWIAAGCILYHAASVADGVDGEMSRATWRSSSLGATLDTSVDMATNLLFILCLSRALYLTYDHVHAWVAVVAFAVLLVGVAALTIIIRLGPGGGSFDTLANAWFFRFRNNTLAVQLGKGFNVVMKRDFFAFAFAVVGAAGLAWLIPWAFLMLAIVWLLVIALCAPTLLAPDSEALRPKHLRDHLK